MARIGWAPCGVCGNAEASVTTNERGTVSLRCHKCEFSGFAKAGTRAARYIVAAMVPDGDAQPVQAEPSAQPKGKKVAEPKQVTEPPKIKNSVFALGDL